MALLAAFIAAVVHPLVTVRRPWQRQTGRARLQLELMERKEQVYASIRELEFDRSLGKVSAEDYQGLRAAMEREAIAVLRQLDSLDSHRATDEETAALVARIEADVAGLRGDVADVAAAPTAPGVAAAGAAQAPTAFCPGCGKTRRPTHRFCPHCGARLDDDPAP